MTMQIGCAHNPFGGPRDNLVLVGGAHLDESIWNETSKLLMDSNASILTLARVGRDADHPAHIKQIADLTCEQIANGSTIVAHGVGGAITNEMVGACPGKIAKIIYLAAFVPLNGERFLDHFEGVGASAYHEVVKIENDRIEPKPKADFYKVIDPDVHLDEKDLPPLHAESTFPSGDRMDVSLNDLNKIPKFYIFTAKDKVFSLERQQKMAARLRLQGVETLNAGHLVMLTQPKELARVIEKFERFEAPKSP